MAKQTTPTCKWTGKRGTKYTYYVYQLPRQFKEADGNYIFAKSVNKKWVPIYIGQGNLKDRVSEQHHKWSCIESKGATHVHVHAQADESAREAEESDLLAHYIQAYEPRGCNEKLGG